MKRILLLLLLLLFPFSARGADLWIANTVDGTLRPVIKPGIGYYSIRLPDSDSSHFTTLAWGNITAARTFTVDLGDANRTLTFTGNATVGGTNTGDQTITLTGDITGSGTGTFATVIANDVIDFADMADSMTLDANLAWASPGNFSVNIDSNTLFVDALNNRVGVGTGTTGISGGVYEAPLTISSTSPFGTLIVLRNTDAAYKLGGVWMAESSVGGGWLFGTDNDGYAVIGYGTAGDETTAISAAKDGVVGITVTTTGIVGVKDKTPDASLEIVNDGVGDSFLVADTNDGDASPFVIQSDGDVGIGTGSPISKLHIAGPPVGYGEARIESLAAGNDYAARLFFENSSNELAKIQYGDVLSGTDYATAANYFTISAPSGDGIIINAGGIENNGLRITSAGLMGLKDSSPDAGLDINNYGSEDSFLVADDGDGDSTPFVINNAGLVGIGTTTPLAGLHVKNAHPTSTLFNGPGSGYGNLIVQDLSTSASAISKITFLTNYNSINWTSGAIGAQWTPSGGGILLFGVGSTGGNYVVNVDMAILENGNVGIRDVSPDASLEVVNDGVGDSFLVADTNDGDATPFVIQSDGDVGILTASPSAALHVTKTTEQARFAYDATKYVKFANVTDANYITAAVNPLLINQTTNDQWNSLCGGMTNNGFDGASINVYGDTFAFGAGNVSIGSGNHASARIAFSLGSTEVARFAKPGDFGLGDTTPDAKMEIVNDGVGDSFLVADTNDSDATPFVVQSDGDVGIGTGSPGNKLEVVDNTANFAARIRQNSVGGYGLQLSNAEDGNYSLAVINAAADTYRHQLYGSGNAVFSYGAGNVGIRQLGFGSSAAGVLAIGSGTAPTTSPADAFQMYSADIAAGEASPHFRTEDGDIIKLFQSAANADTAGATLADLETEVNQLKTLLRDHGFLSP